MTMKKTAFAILAFGFAAGALLAQKNALQIRLSADSFKHVIVYYEPGRTGSHPANGAVWSWGNEILVGFSRNWSGWVDVTKPWDDYHEPHFIDRNKRGGSALARSLDGGETWKLEVPGDDYVGGKPVPCPGVDFSNPDLAIRVQHTGFRVSYDRGKTWQGPYDFTGLKSEMIGDMTSRTDYMVNGPRDAFFFLSGTEPKVNAGKFKDRAFCARTRDGGKTFEFVAWMTQEPITTRSVMPSTVRVSPTELVSALRRRTDLDGKQKAWVDVYASTDNGATWAFRSKVGDTGHPLDFRNGNPPAMVRLKDGRLIVAYGYRFPPYSMRARISNDIGKTWGPEILLKDDAPNYDFGYPRMVVRPDGKVVTMYYFNTEKNPELHIVATIWDPNAAESKK